MNEFSNPPMSTALPRSDYYNPRNHRTVSWPAIFAGIFAALALQFLFMLLGAGLGFAAYHPISSESPIANLSAGAIVIHGISAVLSLWFGGWVAGRFTPVGARAAAWLHGFIVWCTATVAALMIVSLGAGWMMGEVSKLVGGGLSMAGKPVAAAAGGLTDLAKDAAKQNSDTISSFIDEAIGNRNANDSRASAIRAKREVGLAVAQLFSPTQTNNRDENRSTLIKALVEYTNTNQADATRTVDEWLATYDRLKAQVKDAADQAEAKARQAAEEGAHALAIFSFCAFAAFVFGALAASLGACHGGKVASKWDEGRPIAIERK